MECFWFGVCREDTESGDGETRDSFSDSWSDDSESDKKCRCDGCSSEGGSEQDNPCPRNDRLGRLYFQYFERSTPYGRVPLMDKVGVFFALAQILQLVAFFNLLWLAFFSSFQRLWMIKTKQNYIDLLRIIPHPFHDRHLVKRNCNFWLLYYKIKNCNVLS